MPGRLPLEPVVAFNRITHDQGGGEVLPIVSGGFQYDELDRRQPLKLGERGGVSRLVRGKAERLAHR